MGEEPAIPYASTFVTLVNKDDWKNNFGSYSHKMWIYLGMEGIHPKFIMRGLDGKAGNNTFKVVVITDLKHENDNYIITMQDVNGNLYCSRRIITNISSCLDQSTVN